MVKFTANLYARSANEVRQGFDGAGLVLAPVLVSVESTGVLEYSHDAINHGIFRTLP